MQRLEPAAPKLRPTIPLASRLLLAASIGLGQTAPIDVVAEASAPRVREEALPVAMLTWTEACALYGVDAEAVEPAPKVVLHRDVADYEAACDRLGCSNLKRNLAFAEWTQFSAHVVLQPTLQGDAAARFAPTFETLRLVAHESAHLVRYGKFPNHRSHPGWFADGNASWLEAKVLTARKLMTTPEQTPRLSTNVLRGQRMAERKRLPSVDALVHDRTDELEFFDRYAARWLLFRFLVEGPRAKAFRGFPGEMRKLGGGDDFVDRSAEALRKQLGVANWAKLDAEFRTWLAALKPEWDEASGTLETAGDEWIQSTYDGGNAVAFVTSSAGSKPYAIEGTLTAFADRAAAPQMNVLVGRQIASDDSSRFVSVAFVPGVAVTLFAYDGTEPENDRWRQLARAEMKSTAVGAPLRFRIECAPKAGKAPSSALTVKVEGTAIAEATVARLLDGAYGLGVQAGSTGTWKGVRLVAGAR